jgi:acyl-coenzyme A thioesterase PaaI-like protein
MDGESQESPYYSKLITVTEGEWAGWQAYPGGDAFEDLTGPFYYRIDADGGKLCAFRAEEKHMNGGGFMHGGCVMTFADFCLFVIARDVTDGSRTVTATFNCELVGTARAGELVECTGDVVKAGRSMVFVRGIITAPGGPVASFSSVLKKTTIRAS